MENDDEPFETGAGREGAALTGVQGYFPGARNSSRPSVT